jgi:DNA-binding LacI/PurR family transcriptional regulator
MGPLKMEDIARLSGVSRQTVSAVLNGKDWVSQGTRDHVLRVIEQHQYTPNRQALSLAGKRTRLIGVVLRDISNPFYTQLAMGIEAVAREHAHGLLYYNTHEDHDIEVEATRELVGFNADGLIISPVLVGVDLDHLWRTAQKGKPLVSIDRVPGLACDCVEFDNEPAARDATRHLLSRGHRRIGFLGGPETSSSAQQRLNGFRAELLEHGARLDPALVRGAGATADERHAAARALLTLPPAKRPTAILCFNDLIAISVYRVAHDLRLRIPDDVSVVGFDDIEMAALLGPPLTTVRLDSREAGATAARLLIERLEAEGEKAPARRVMMKPLLVERGSVAGL